MHYADWTENEELYKGIDVSGNFFIMPVALTERFESVGFCMEFSASEYSMEV